MYYSVWVTLLYSVHKVELYSKTLNKAVLLQGISVDILTVEIDFLVHCTELHKYERG